MEVHVKNLQSKVYVNLCEIERSLAQIKRILNCTAKRIDIILIDDEGIRSFNRRYLQRDTPTNVLAFSLQEGEFANINPSILGDVIISVETARRDALSGEMPLADMIDFLMIHGILHLLGYDHEKDEIRASKMIKKQQEVFGILHDYTLED
ncbi:MAG: rRNA maturation RNase YbeY [Syntrophales bacterium]|nr:rRNA maturation RNase YbeY [Syntrophales bacterium]